MKYGIILVIIGLVLLGASASAPLQIVKGSTAGSVSYTLSGTASMTPSTINSGGTVTLTLQVSSETNSPSAMFQVFVNGAWLTKTSSIITTTGTYIHLASISVSSTQSVFFRIAYISYYNTLTHSFAYSYIKGNSIQVTQSISAPIVTSVGATPNPVIVGEVVTFSSNVNWNGNTGSVTYSVLGAILNGNTYTFNSVGSFVVTATATNSVGSNTNTVSVTVQNSGSSGNVQNVGTFYVRDNTSLYQLTSGNIVNLSAHKLPETVTFYYVESNGMTLNASYEYITLIDQSNTHNNPQIYFNSQNSFITVVHGYSAIGYTIQLPAGSYTVNAFVQPISTPTIKVVSTVLNNQALIQPVVPSVLTTFEGNYQIVIIGSIFLFAGIIGIVKKW